MKFIEWRDANEFGDCSAKAAWEYQQERIDELEHKLALREAFIAGLQFSKSQSSNDQANGGE